MRALLDVNALLALFDTEHQHHETAADWWAANRDEGWASCPFTQNGYLRIVSQRAYLHPISIGAAISTLTSASADQSHAFWPDDLSLLDDALIDHGAIVGPKQLTDIYLLALAVKNDGRLVTFDRAIPLAAVRHASPDHLVQL